MNSLFGVSGIGLTGMIILIGVFINIVLISFYALIAKNIWAKDGKTGDFGPKGPVGERGDEGKRGIRGFEGKMKGIMGNRGLSGGDGKIPDAKICKPFSNAKYYGKTHPCKESVLRGWSQIDWFEKSDEYPNNVACVPSRLSNKGKSSIVAFFGGPQKPDFASTGNCESGTCYVGNNADSINNWIKSKNLPPNVRLQPGNELERRSNLCVAGDSQMSNEEAGLIDVDSSLGGIDPETGMPRDYSGRDKSGQKVDNTISASEDQGRMHDLGADSAMGYVRGSENDKDIVVGTVLNQNNSNNQVVEEFKNPPVFGGSISNPVTQKEPTECTTFKLEKLWGLPENKIGSSGFACSSNLDCANGYECINKKCSQKCVGMTRNGLSIKRDKSGRCLCESDDHCKYMDNEGNENSDRKCDFFKNAVRGGVCKDEESKNYWKCSRVNDKCGPLGTNWNEFANNNENWDLSSNSTFTCLNEENAEKGCLNPPCWHKVRKTDENGIGAKSLLEDSEGNPAENQGLWVSNKNWQNWDEYNVGLSYENTGALVPCGNNPNNLTTNCDSSENNDWIKGTSSLTHKWAGSVSNKAKNSKGGIADYMKTGTRDIISADPVSILDARDNQCKDWIGYYSGRVGEVKGKGKINDYLNNNNLDTLKNSENGDIQPYYPGLCVAKQCIGKHRILKQVGEIVSPKSPTNSQQLVLRHKTFKDNYPKLSRPADKASGIFKACRCPGGYFSPKGDLKADCVECPAGTYLPSELADMGFTYCLDCPPGTYQDEIGATKCKPCPGGFYQDEWGKKACKGCKCGFKCPELTEDENSQFDISVQLPKGNDSFNIDVSEINRNFRLGRKYPKPCVSGEYCPGNKDRIRENNFELRPFDEQMSNSTDYLAEDPHYYPQKDRTTASCSSCEDDVPATSVYCQTKGNCDPCPCPDGHYCPDKTEPINVGGTNDIDGKCMCPNGHKYDLTSLDKNESVVLIANDGVSKTVKKTGAGEEVRCCREGQCCDVNIEDCVGEGRRNHGFAWPVSSPEGYYSKCREHGSGIVNGVIDDVQTSPKDDSNCDVSGCQNDSYICNNGSIVCRNPDDNCNFLPCPIDDGNSNESTGSNGGDTVNKCTQDVKKIQCNGEDVFVNRDENNNCNFRGCDSISSDSKYFSTTA